MAACTEIGIRCPGGAARLPLFLLRGRLLTSGDQEAAIALLLEALREDPKLFTARRLLAVNLSRHPTLCRTAERHFLAALDLEPGDTDLRYQLALYYRNAGLRARAMVQLQSLLASDPPPGGTTGPESVAGRRGSRPQARELDHDGSLNCTLTAIQTFTGTPSLVAGR